MDSKAFAFLGRSGKRTVVWLVVLALLLAGALWLRSRPAQAEVVHPKRETLAEILAASGQVRGRDESRLAPEVSGTVKEILVEEGDKVQRGAPLAKLETERLQAQVDQAAERVKVAEAQLRLAERPPLPSEFAELQSQNQQAVQSAEANLESARQQLLEATTGPRLEQKNQAKSELLKAQAESAQRRRDHGRQEELYRRGAVSKQNYEQSLTLSREADAVTERAAQALAELENGTRPEQLARYQQSVFSAQSDLRAAHETGEAKVQQLRERPRPEDVALAKAQVDEAEAAYQVALKQLDQAVVLAPYHGTVGRKLLRPGDPAGPNAPILTFASSPALEVRVELDESERSRVKKGMPAEVRANGYDTPFSASVEEFAAEIDSVTGTLETRLRTQDPPTWLLPGQTVDVNIILSPQSERMIVPLTSVILDAASASVLVVEGSQIKRLSVVVSNPSKEGYLVLEGLRGDELVVQFPQSFAEGVRVRPKLVEF